jgi:pyruvate-formate lyase-activating enzyme
MDSKKLIFYGAGENAEIKHGISLSKIGHRKPVAFCDRATHKQGKQFLDYPVMSFDDAVAKFDDFDVYVTAGELNAPEIIGFLLENGVGPERIVNYEPVEKRLGCSLMESWLTLEPVDDHLEFSYCCTSGELGRFAERFKNVMSNSRFLDKESFSRIIEDKVNIGENIKQGFQYPICSNCWHRSVKYHFKNFRIRKLAFSGYAPCNFACYNCAQAKQWNKNKKNPWRTLLDNFIVIEDSGLLADDCYIILVMGEYSIVKNHDMILRRLSKYPLLLSSNAYLWSEPTARALGSGTTWLRVSVEAGTRETFQRIKGVDGFAQVCANLKKYADIGNVILKYIIFPGINDNEIDLNGFFELCDKLGARANLSRDYAYMDDFSDETLEIAVKFILHFQKTGKLYGMVEVHPSERIRIQSVLKIMNAPSIL